MPSGGNLDAFLFFGTAGTADNRLPPNGVNGETTDSAANALSKSEYGSPLELKSYSFRWQMDDNWAEEWGKDKTKFRHKPQWAPLSISKSYDSASPSLFIAVQNASVFEKVMLVHRRAGGQTGHQTFLTVTLKKLIVLSVGWQTDDSGALSEIADLEYSDISIEYTAQHSSGGDNKQNSAKASGAIDFPKSSESRLSSVGGIDETKLQTWIEDVSKVTRVNWE
jgi:type VI protein secretion system component Hcp